MKYLCLVYHEEQKLDALSQPQMDALVATRIARLKNSIQRPLISHRRDCIGADGVHRQAPQRQTIRLTVLFAETKEILGGSHR